MDKIYFNQSIKCNVSNCKHFDHNSNACMLASIEINSQKSKSKKETFCESFESK